MKLHKHGRKKFGKIIGTTIIGLAMIAVLLRSSGLKEHRVEAAEVKKETVQLRIIGTTDLHGQLNSKDYEKGVDYNNGGLARVMDLISKTKKELPKNNTITLDAGDVLFDYTTEYIFSEKQDEVQPIYKAMAELGYDAITLGNHDFDYGYDYILRQLNQSGLRGITVVSNVTDSKTGEYPFLEHMLITRSMETSSGKKVDVKIGIIGHTIPTLTSKTHSYAGILKTEDMVDNARKEAKKLKELGADIVISLSHTGIGPEDPEENFKNVAYALTKIPEIDVVVAGHEHNLYPTTDMTSPYYKLPNVDKKTYLMNGKNVIMAGDRGRAIGVVDLTLEIKEAKFTISDRKSELRFVTAQSTNENTKISKMYGTWEEKLLEYSTEVIGELEKDHIIQNYFGLLGDNSAIQLLNNSKIHYALTYANTTGKAYKDLPIIAASTYDSYGANGIDNYINITDKITESDLSVIQSYNNYLYLYKITGKQLREWLEWSASAYENIYSYPKWSDKTMASLMESSNLKSLIREEWLDDWSNFYVFDGVEYVINPNLDPRYDFSGNKITNNYRVERIRYNGVDVTDDMEFLLATNKITKPVAANKGIENQSVLRGFVRAQSVLTKYIEQVSESGILIPHVDNNWKVNVSSSYRFLVKMPSYADSLFKVTPWYVSYLEEVAGYKYYTAKFSGLDDKDAPNILVSPLVTSATKSAYDVAVFVSDASKITMAKMVEGNVAKNFDGWVVAKDVLNKTFTVRKNNTYTIMAEDIHGNRQIRTLEIQNFNENMLATPTVVNYTNRKSSITGTGEPNTTIVFETYTGTYESKVDSNGKYSYSLPGQPSGSVVSVYLKDEKTGLLSERVNVTVKRTGPNQPSVNPILNVQNYIHGYSNDSDAFIVAKIDDVFYVSSKGGKELLQKNTEVYLPKQKIVETYAEIDALGMYQMVIPPMKAGTTVSIFNLDHVGRNSRVTTAKVADMGPNAPVVHEVSNIDKSISGYISSPQRAPYVLDIVIDGNSYTAFTDNKGNFKFNYTEQLYGGQNIEVSAIETVDGKLLRSFVTHTTVLDVEDLLFEDEETFRINSVTVESSSVTGYSSYGGEVLIAIGSGEGNNFRNDLYTVAVDDTRYRYSFDKAVKSGDIIYSMVRLSNGRILEVAKTVVLPGTPEMPQLVKDITNAVKTVEVISEKDVEISVQIGNKTFTSKEYSYSEKTKQYIYTVAIDRMLSKTEVKVSASNEAGTSEILKSKVVKAAPDSPKVDEISSKSKTVTGKIDLFDAPLAASLGTTMKAGDMTKISNSELESTKDQKAINKLYKKVPTKVANTQTRVFAQIDGKTYEGTIDNSGKFKIEIPSLTSGKKVTVWGTNKAGRGPLIKVTVR